MTRRVCTYAMDTPWVMDWNALREGLRLTRLQSGHSLRALRDATGIDPSTMHRIENVKRYPDYRPDLETVDALLRAMHSSLAEFFARLERISVSAVLVPSVDAELLAEIADPEKAAQALAFLRLPEPLRVAVVQLPHAADTVRTTASMPARSDAPPRAHIQGIRTKSAGGRRR